MLVFSVISVMLAGVFFASNVMSIKTDIFQNKNLTVRYILNFRPTRKLIKFRTENEKC